MLISISWTQNYDYVSGHKTASRAGWPAFIIKKMVKDRKVVHQQKLASLESQGVTYVVADREFHCRYCNSYIRSNDCMKAKLHTRTTKHMNKQERIVERNEAQRKLSQILVFARSNNAELKRQSKG